jgi:hypothetical protein
MGLNADQRRSLTVALRLVERALHDITLAVDGSWSGALTGTETVLDPATRDDLLALIAAAGRQIAALANEWELAPERRDSRGAITAALSSCWEMLEDTRPEKLRRYGPVDPAVAERLGPQIAALVELVHAMQDTVAGRRRTAGPAP